MQPWLNNHLLWTQFVVCGAVIVFVGSKLSVLGDVIGEKLKVGNTWIGLVLLAAITSMPELITSCSAARIGDANIAIGNLFGSNVINIAILGILGLLMPGFARQESRPSRHFLSCGFGLLITSTAILAIVAYRLAPYKLESLHRFVLRGRIGPGSVLLLGVYLLAMFLMSVFEKNETLASQEPPVYDDKRLAPSLVKFFLLAAIIVCSGWRMVVLGDILAEKPIDILGARIVLGQSVIGTFFLALATSLPELVVFYSAVKIGAIDMAIGNIFGSNIFNVGVIFFADIFFKPGPILAAAGVVHVLTGVMGMLLTGIFIIGSAYRTTSPRLGHLGVCVGIVIAWVIGSVLIFTLGRG